MIFILTCLLYLISSLKYEQNNQYIKAEYLELVLNAVLLVGHTQKKTKMKNINIKTATDHS